jgi:pimeloyl-ACP methyl ester carboxylesterase
MFKYYDSGGKKPVLLFLHGLNNSKNAVERFKPEFTKEFRLIVPDLPGHNKLSLSKINKLDDFIFYIQTFLKVLKIKEYYVFGYSLGSILSVKLSEKDPNAKALVLWASPILGIEKGVYALPRAAVPLTKKIPQETFMSILKLQFLNSIMRALISRGFMEGFEPKVWGRNLDMRNALRIVDILNTEEFKFNICVPTLFLFDKYDPIISMKNHDYVKQYLTAKKYISVELIDLCGHLRNKKGFDKMNDAALTFLKKQSYEQSNS